MKAPRTYPGGVMILERYAMEEDEECDMSADVRWCHQGVVEKVKGKGENKCSKPACIPVEFRAMMLWGRMYNSICYGSPACGYGKQYPYVVFPGGFRKWASNQRKRPKHKNPNSTLHIAAMQMR